MYLEMYEDVFCSEGLNIAYCFIAHSRRDVIHNANSLNMFQENVNRNIPLLVFSHDTLQIIALQKELKKSKAEHQVCAVALEELKFLNSHQIRHAVCQIVSLSGLLEKVTHSRKANVLISFIQTAASSLDMFSRKMTKVFENQECAGKVDE